MINDVIRNEYDDPVRNEMVQAAYKWRLPYWDWAQKKNGGMLSVPYLLTMKQVTIRGRTGNITVKNPLWRFEMPGGETMGKYGIQAIPATDGRTLFETVHVRVSPRMFVLTHNITTVGELQKHSSLSENAERAHPRQRPIDKYNIR